MGEPFNFVSTVLIISSDACGSSFGFGAKELEGVGVGPGFELPEQPTIKVNKKVDRTRTLKNLLIGDFDILRNLNGRGQYHHIKV